MNKMKIGISSPAFALEPFEESLKKVTDSGFKLWEISADLNQYLPNIKDQFKELVPSYDIEIAVHAPFNDINIAALNPTIRTRSVNFLLRTIDVSVKLDIDLITFHPGHLCPAGMYAPELVHKVNKFSISDIADHGNQYESLSLALENMPMKGWTLGNTADELIDIIGDNPLDICFDVGHANITGSIDELLKLASKFKDTHFHDNNGKRDSHLVIGEGNIDFDKIIYTLLKNGYKGNIIIESNNIEEGIAGREKLKNILAKHCD
jgi:sugar phosphate isomerase/epimerase